MRENYLIESIGGIPTLNIGEGYLSWFRGYRMQVSMTSEGVGNKGASSSTMHHDLRAIDEYKLTGSENDLLKSFILLAHVWQASGTYTEFWKDMKSDSYILDDLLQQTADEVDDNFPDKVVSVNELLSYVTVEEIIEIDSALSQTFHLVVNKKSAKYHVGTVELADNFIALHSTLVGKWFVLNLDKVLGKPEESKIQLGSSFVSCMLHVLEAKASIVNTINGFAVDGVNDYTKEVTDEYLENLRESENIKVVEAHRVYQEIESTRNIKLVRSNLF